MSNNFPNSPALNDVYIFEGLTYTWNGAGWVASPIDNLLDEDDMVSDSDTQAPTQQSAKAYTDTNASPATIVGKITTQLGSTGWKGSSFGPTGARGSTAVTGSTGITGSDGFVGSQGFNGSQGPQGITGSTGFGFAGSQGWTGSHGFYGSQGFTGSQGISFTGSIGVIGYTGSEGVGFIGSRGTTGFIGSMGPSLVGSQGVTGFVGSAGAPFNYVSVTGVVQNLDVSNNFFFDGNDINANISLNFTNVAPEIVWTWTGRIQKLNTVNSFTYDLKSYSMLSGFGLANGVAFDDTGNRMYVTSDQADTVTQYTLTTSFDLATATWDSISLDVSPQDTDPRSLVLGNSGTRLYLVGAQNSSVYQYNLGTAWDITTATFITSFSVNSEDTQPEGIAFDDTGTQMFVSGNQTNSVYAYTLATAWDLSTATYDSVSFDASSQTPDLTGMAFNNNGNRMVLIGKSARTLYQYALTTPYDLSTASYGGVSLNTGLSVPEGALKSLTFGDNEERMFLLGTDFSTVYQFSAPGGYSTVILPATVEGYSIIDINDITSVADGQQLVIDFSTGNGGAAVYLINLENI